VTESTRFVIEVLLFAGVGTALGLGALLLGALLRPKNPGGLKDEIYECGEPTIGPAWVQFDLRFYVVALVFVVFDVEIALLYPWAVVYKDYIAQGLGSAAFWAMVFFLGLLTSGFLYLWRFGYLDWVRAAAPQESRGPEPQPAVGGPRVEPDAQRYFAPKPASDRGRDARDTVTGAQTLPEGL
jgi:NADH-quinone oxidoreductase subunit A